MAQAAVHIVDSAIARPRLGGRRLRGECVPVHIVGSCSHARRRTARPCGVWSTAGGWPWTGRVQRPQKRRSVPRTRGAGRSIPGTCSPGGPAAQCRRRQPVALPIIAGQPAAVITDAQGALGTFMHEFRAAHVMRMLRQRGSCRVRVAIASLLVIAFPLLMPWTSPVLRPPRTARPARAALVAHH